MHSSPEDPRETPFAGPPDDLIDGVYAVAVDPTRLQELQEIWNRRMVDRGGPSTDSLAALDHPHLGTHIRRAADVMDRIAAADDAAERYARGDLARLPSAAFVLDQAGRVVAVNAACSEAFGLAPGHDIDRLPLSPEERAALSRAAAQVLRRPGTEPVILRFAVSEEGRTLLFRLTAAAHGRVLAATTELAWPPSLSDLLVDTFGLTGKEAETLRDLSLGATAREIAERRQRSEATVRTHIQMLLQKTGARSQTEAVRLALGLMTVIGMPDPAGSVQAMTLPDGRRLEYLTFGPAGGRPFLWLHSPYGLTRLPAPAESSLARRRLRMISPIRASYGGSDPAPAGRNIHQVTAEDLVALQDHLGIARCPVGANGNDTRSAVEMALASADRLSAIVLCGALFPISRPEQLMRVHPWTRFMGGNAKYAPAILPFLIRSGFGMLRRLGRRRFLEAVLGTAPSDLVALQDPAIMAAIEAGSVITWADGFTAQDGFSRDLISFWQDWAHRFRICPVPIHVIHGQEDPESSILTVREYAAEPPVSSLTEVPNAGRLVPLTHADLLLDAVERVWDGQTSLRSDAARA